MRVLNIICYLRSKFGAGERAMCVRALQRLPSESTSRSSVQYRSPDSRLCWSQRNKTTLALPEFVLDESSIVSNVESPVLHVALCIGVVLTIKSRSTMFQICQFVYTIVIPVLQRIIAAR